MNEAIQIKDREYSDLEGQLAKLEGTTQFCASCNELATTFQEFTEPTGEEGTE